MGGGDNALAHAGIARIVPSTANNDKFALISEQFIERALSSFIEKRAGFHLF